ncbi:MAG: carboxynorspermidine decarboxylase [Verrucomicrobia bacterium]|nr:MAG: carboxynorspermidine decarboxylase [Verrucomicrobiota bacterium]
MHDTVPLPIPSGPCAEPSSLRIAQAFRESGLDTPCFVFDQDRFHQNGAILRGIQDRCQVEILLAQKAFSSQSLYPLLRQYLSGTTSSGLHEALHAHRHFGGEVHVFAPAYKDREMDELLRIADHLVFNSLGQWQRFREKVLTAPRRPSPGLRVNPEYSAAAAALYDPCAAGSRFGVLASALEGSDLSGIEGLHFHVLCEKFHDALEQALGAVEDRFGKWLPAMKWLNMGGGHLLTSPKYDLDHLHKVLSSFAKRHPNLKLYLEPGEAVAYQAGCLIGTVQDIVENGMSIAILDLSATCHMPDVLEMPYRPPLLGAGEPGEKPFTYRLGGPTCLAGDVIGDFSFDKPLQIGDQLVFEDQAYYTVVKTTTFNGVNLPSLALYRDQRVELIKEFGYEDFAERLG